MRLIVAAMMDLVCLSALNLDYSRGSTAKWQTIGIVLYNCCQGVL